MVDPTSADVVRPVWEQPAAGQWKAVHKTMTIYQSDGESCYLIGDHGEDDSSGYGPSGGEEDDESRLHGRAEPTTTTTTWRARRVEHRAAERRVPRSNVVDDDLDSFLEDVGMEQGLGADAQDDDGWTQEGWMRTYRRRTTTRRWTAR